MSRPWRMRVHQALRQATAECHHALDQHPLLRQLTCGNLTRERYAESLAAMYLPHARLERLVHQSRHHPDSGCGLSARLDRLEADLIELALPVPLLPPIPADPVDGRAAWWGRVYVLEGSRQGSAVISRCIHSSLGDSVPSRFLGEPVPPGTHAALLAILERELDDPHDLVTAVASARAAFSRYRDDLDAFDDGSRAVASGKGEAMQQLVE